MTRLRLLLIGLLVLPLASSAQDSDALLPGGLCLQQMNGQLVQQQRIERAILFGRLPASFELVGNTRFDMEGNPWIKTGDDKWRSAAPGFEKTTWTDTQVDRQTEWEGMNEEKPDSKQSQRIGIFETKKALTSELIPSVLQAYRAFQCRTVAVCQGLEDLWSGSGPDKDGMLTVTTPGCEPIKIKALTACPFSVADTDYLNALDLGVLLTQCRPNADALITREEAMIKLAVSYDAGYRSLLQFAGNFDLFLGEFKTDLLNPIEKAMPLLSQLSRVPCFVSQCQQ